MALNIDNYELICNVLDEGERLFFENYISECHGDVKNVILYAIERLYTAGEIDGIVERFVRILTDRMMKINFDDEKKLNDAVKVAALFGLLLEEKFKRQNAVNIKKAIKR